MLERLWLCAILRSNVNTELQDVSLIYVSKVFTLLFYCGLLFGLFGLFYFCLNYFLKCNSLFCVAKTQRPHTRYLTIFLYSLEFKLSINGSNTNCFQLLISSLCVLFGWYNILVFLFLFFISASSLQFHLMQIRK